MSFDEAVKSIYARHSAGCCLHLVLDDLNTDSLSVVHCWHVALNEGHEDCADAAGLLLDMPSESERELHIALAKGDIS